MRRDPGTRLPDAASFALEIEDTGPVNADFDRAFLAALRDGAAMPFVRQWTADAIEELAGNGVHEIRNWLTVAGIVADAAAETLAYEPVAEWLTGTAVARFLLPEAAA
jgi:protocatechuate 4,5-dioxygenase beta chain/2,3-dihydroxyphenylpropionate 1,2-dioxygenase